MTEARRRGDVIAHRTGKGAAALVVHPGFLDDATVWHTFADLAAEADLDVALLEPAGVGGRAGAPGPYTLQRMADDAGAVVDSLGKPCVVVGQSMGAQVAELVAAPRAESVRGLVLVTPVPLAGTRLPDADIAPFRALGGQCGSQRAVRTQLSVSNSPETLDLLVESGVRIPPPVVAALADAWNDGDPAGEAPSNYRGPVLVVRGAGDGFVTDEMVRGGVIPRFAQPRTALVEQAGHWPHAEQPASLAAAVLSFVAQVTAAGSRI